MAIPIVANNSGQAILSNGTYCTATVPGWMNEPGVSIANQPQFWEVSYFVLAGSTGAGTICTFQGQNNDSTWTTSAIAPITLANSTTYNGALAGPVGSIRLVVSSLAGNGILYTQLAGIPSLDLGGPALQTGAVANQTAVKTFSALDNHPPATAYATFATRNALGVLQFPHAGADTSAIFIAALPNPVTIATGLKIVINWASVTATTGNAEWAASVDNVANAHTLDSDSYGTAVSQITATNAVAAYINATVISLTSLQNLSVDAPFKLKITRRASDVANDTMADTASLLTVEVYTY